MLYRPTQLILHIHMSLPHPHAYYEAPFANGGKNGIAIAITKKWWRQASERLNTFAASEDLSADEGVLAKVARQLKAAKDLGIPISSSPLNSGNAFVTGRLHRSTVAGGRN